MRAAGGFLTVSASTVPADGPHLLKDLQRAIRVALAFLADLLRRAVTTLFRPNSTRAIFLIGSGTSRAADVPGVAQISGVIRSGRTVFRHTDGRVYLRSTPGAASEVELEVRRSVFLYRLIRAVAHVDLIREPNYEELLVLADNRPCISVGTHNKVTAQRLSWFCIVTVPSNCLPARQGSCISGKSHGAALQLCIPC
jgi:hypothetical protein